jgi:CheY-like chemotaxis protein
LYGELQALADDVEFISTTDAAQVLTTLEECPAHLVLLNAQGMSELWSTAKQIRERTHRTPIVGCAIPHHLTRSLESGASNYLVKPVLPADLERAVRALDWPVRRILVVDDDPDVLALFTRMLHMVDSEIEVVTASSGEQALEVLRDRHPDLMLLDIVMPDMDGWQVMALKVADHAIKDIPVIFVSAQNPADQWATSPLLVATTPEGLSLSQLLHCSLALSSLLLAPVVEPAPAPV